MRWLLPLVLAGCAGAQTLPVASIPLRNPAAPVASQADVTLSRLSGDWIVVSGVGPRPGTRIRMTATTFETGGVILPLRDDGQGRLRVGDAVLWVHWLDVGDRTAVLGDPEGSRVWIMDRTGRPSDRLRPAREILDWYGYDLSRLKES